MSAGGEHERPSARAFNPVTEGSIPSAPTWPIPRGRFPGGELAGGVIYYDGDDFETRLCFYWRAVLEWYRKGREYNGVILPIGPPPLPEPELLLYSGEEAAREGRPGIPPLHVHEAGRWAEDIWLEGWLAHTDERHGGQVRESAEPTRFRYFLDVDSDPPVTYTLGDFDAGAIPRLTLPVLPPDVSFSVRIEPMIETANGWEFCARRGDDCDGRSAR